MKNKSSRLPKLPGRDYAAESELLMIFTQKILDYAVLQRDWSNTKHGDLDIALNQRDWKSLVDLVVDYSNKNNFPIVKSYEIEYGVICIVMLTNSGTVFLDVAIAGACKHIFGVNLKSALQRSETVDGVQVISEYDCINYASNKNRFKASRSGPLLNKIKNIPIILRRIIECTLFFRGAALYIPYLLDTDILKSAPVATQSRRYLESKLCQRYGL